VKTWSRVRLPDITAKRGASSNVSPSVFSVPAQLSLMTSFLLGQRLSALDESIQVKKPLYEASE
jgi:hypothetical protein